MKLKLHNNRRLCFALQTHTRYTLSSNSRVPSERQTSLVRTERVHFCTHTRTTYHSIDLIGTQHSAKHNFAAATRLHHGCTTRSGTHLCITSKTSMFCKHLWTNMMRILPYLYCLLRVDTRTIADQCGPMRTVPRWLVQGPEFPRVRIHITPCNYIPIQLLVLDA